MSTLQTSTLSIIQNQLIRYVSLVLLVTGTIGNVLNCFVFTRRWLRDNSCSLYFFATSIANLIGLYCAFISRVLITFNIYTTPSQSAVYCKTRTFFTYMPLSASTWFVVAACADRFASSSSSVRMRSFSQTKVSRRVICGIVVIVCLVWAEMFVCFNGNPSGTTCAPATPFCNTFNNFNLLISYSLLPPIFMFILGWMTIRHVRHRQIHRQSSSKNRQLTILLIVQVLCVTFLSLPFSVQRIYLQFTINQMKSSQRIEIENFLGTVATLIILSNTTMSFYMFTLTSQVFRKELKPLLFFSSRRRADVEPTLSTTGTAK
ncbi:unnamed protein product [Rotaria magnacalcarata]|uniref:G-protein coupled receptors family 1 profile domain-containing protein n=5 Tax=Rotaria magnacalcarata TaxID=392030 RepID=A0A819Y3I3_9BILA|nr:unnamed protein product [Rotaria magnacalcarata]CAF4153090.1 unnamed protein product [Rotaria magnacalcarata]